MRTPVVVVMLVLVPLSAAAAPAAKATDPARLFAGVAACWFGPVWGDALGEAEPQRKAGTERRCAEAAALAWGAGDTTHVLQLRAFEPNAVDDVVARLGADKALADTLVTLAAAQRENMMARRAADRVKKDLDESGTRKLTVDEVAAVTVFRAQGGVERLWASAQRDAHALAVLSAMDRLEMARGLPKHMKIYALAGVGQLLFGLRAKLPAGPATHAVPGEWLGFLSELAAAAGHAAPSDGDAKRRNALAWGGVLEGFADKLRPEATKVAPELRPFVEGVVRRLESEYTGIRNAERK